MPSITASDIVELFEKDVGARKRLAELLVTEPDVRLAIINAVLRDVATKSDIEKLREEVKNDLEKLREEFKIEIGRVEREISRVESEISRVEGSLGSRITRLEDRLGKLEERVARLEARVNMVMITMVAFNVPILVAVIGILLRLAFAPTP